VQAADLFDAIAAIVPMTTESGPLQASEVWNQAMALAHVGGDPDLLRELAGVFLTDCPHRLADVRSAVANADAAKLKLAAHTIKGAVSNFAARAAKEAAQRLETMGQHGDMRNALEALAILEMELERLRPVLATLTGTEASLV
jgi:HPt (histidine-containing phosphotransfer) domain-containing protein